MAVYIVSLPFAIRYCLANSLNVPLNRTMVGCLPSRSGKTLSSLACLVGSVEGST